MKGRRWRTERMEARGWSFEIQISKCRALASLRGGLVHPCAAAAPTSRAGPMRDLKGSPPTPLEVAHVPLPSLRFRPSPSARVRVVFQINRRIKMRQFVIFDRLDGRTRKNNNQLSLWNVAFTTLSLEPPFAPFEIESAPPPGAVGRTVRSDNGRRAAAPAPPPHPHVPRTLAASVPSHLRRSALVPFAAPSYFRGPTGPVSTTSRNPPARRRCGAMTAPTPSAFVLLTQPRCSQFLPHSRRGFAHAL
jgi:hypothetical protein